MISTLNHRSFHHLLLIALGLLMFFVNLGSPALWDVDEGRNSTAALEMYASGDWIVPRFNGELRVDKPVLLYWLQMAAYSLFGIDEFSARLPSAVAALLTMLICYELARSMFSRTTGLLAGIIVGTTPMLCGAGRFANPDALLNFCTAATLAVFWVDLGCRRWWWFLTLGAVTGLAVLAKGPVGIALPGAVILLYVCWERRWEVLWDRRWCIAFWSFLLVALPWYGWVFAETKGEFWRGFFLRHNLERGLSAMENHRGFPGYYVVILLVGTAPWSIFLGAAWWVGVLCSLRSPWPRWRSWWERASEQPESVETPRVQDAPAAYRLLLVWIVVYLAFFSVAATKLPNYALPVVLPSAILTARLLHRWQTNRLRLPQWFTWSCLGALIGMGGSLGLGLSVAGGVGEFAFMRGRFIPGLERWAILGALPILAAMCGWWFLRTERYGRFVTAFAACAVLCLAPAAAFASAVFNTCKAPRPLVEQADAMRRSEDIRIGCRNVGHLPSLNFYLRRNVIFLEDDKAVAELLRARIPVYLFIPLEDWQAMQPGMNGRIVARHYDMYHHAELVVITNQ